MGLGGLIMGTTAEKLTYLNGTKRLLRRRLNSLGAEITLETKFRDYLLWLDRFYNAASSGVDFELLGETEQRAVNSSVNILPLYDDEIVTDGVTVTISNGKITINGTPTRDVWIKITNGMEVEYTNPRPNDGHRWYSEKITEFDEPTRLILQVGKGGGTVASSGNMYHLGYHDTQYPETLTSDSITAFADNVTEEKKISGGRYINNVTEINFVMFHLIAGEALNTYGYLSLATSSQTYWTPNYDAAPASPDNPKRIINKEGEITYTASDGTEFPINLVDINLRGNPNPNGTPDKIYYANGDIYLKKNVETNTLTGAETEAWRNIGRVNTERIWEGRNNAEWYPEHFCSMYSICDCFENALNSNITEEETAIEYLNIYQYAILAENNIIYVKFSDKDAYTEENSFIQWLRENSMTIQYDIEDYSEPIKITKDGYSNFLENYYEPLEITEEQYIELYNQLQAIIDHETKLEIEKKIF
jgi:hypothetical protein